MALSKNLDQFILNGVEGLSDRREKGRGCYGAVYEVRLNGVLCIAKRLHDILVGRGQEQPVSAADRRAAIRRFREECVLLSGLRHPNIVQFMGVHCGRDEADISLIMEYMHMDLEQCMKTYPDIPLIYKTSILRDVAYGLAYLHSLNIIHRDLNAGNVLLTESLKAKIADLGVAKLLDREAAMIRTRTVCPGALDYMPPEALEIWPKYGFKLDSFSFGHLTIYLVNEVVPHVSDSMIMVEDVQNNQIQVGKRRRALDQVSYQMGGSHHPLYSTVVQCLSDTPDQRPTSRDLVRRMEEMCKQHPILHGNTLHMLAELTEKQKFETDQLRSELMSKSTELFELKEALTQLNEKLVRKDHQLTEFRRETATKDRQLAKLSQELRQNNLQSQQLVSHLESELNTTSHTATKLSEEAEQLGAKLHSLAQSFDKELVLKHIQSQLQPAIDDHTTSPAAMAPNTNEKNNQPITSHNSGEHKSSRQLLPATIVCKEQATTKPGASSKLQNCSICLNKITEPHVTPCCQTEFCRRCLELALAFSPYCPECKNILRPIIGNQPDGTMIWYISSKASLPGYNQCATIAIKYDFPNGTQNQYHPNPGQRYHGATCTAYLPNCREGQEVLALLKRAFDNRLIFTIKTSTTGVGSVVWSDIHHKTSMHGGGVNGYPDDTYLQRVKEELKAKGIY